LELAIRYLNRQERTEPEVKAKLEEVQDYVANHPNLKAEWMAGLELFTHLMRESQAGRLRIRYGTPATLQQVEAVYRELSGNRER